MTRELSTISAYTGLDFRDRSWLGLLARGQNGSRWNSGLSISGNAYVRVGDLTYAQRSVISRRSTA